METFTCLLPYTCVNPLTFRFHPFSIKQPREVSLKDKQSVILHVVLYNPPHEQ